MVDPFFLMSPSAMAPWMRLVFVCGLMLTNCHVSSSSAHADDATAPPSADAANIGASRAVDPQIDKDRTVVQALLRLPNVKLESFPSAKESLTRYLRLNAGSEEFFRLVRRFELRELAGQLVDLASKHANDSVRVEAVCILLDWDDEQTIHAVLHGEDMEAVVALLTTLGLSDHSKAVALAQPFVLDATSSPAVQRAAIATLGRHRSGRQVLADRLLAGEFAEELHLTLANSFRDAQDESLWSRVAPHLKLPQSSAKEPIPPLRDLLTITGDAARGAALFRNEATCIKCHQVGSEGKLVGPSLSEIGGKLSREALFVSILDPNAAISFGYEPHTVVLHNGELLTGIIVSQTDEALTLRTAEAITRTIAQNEIEEIVKQTVSLMPAGLVQSISTQQLVDIVEYLTTLRKAGDNPDAKTVNDETRTTP